MLLRNSKFGNFYYPIILITLCSCFLFYKYILQIYPSIISDSLMKEFQLTGAGFGNLGGTFYYSYMFTQLFVGLLLDKFSNRYIMSTAIFSCAIGALYFSQAHTLLGLQLARALTGIGVAFATVGYMKTAAMWFPPRYYATVSGLLATAAMAGAVFGEVPVAFLVNVWGWRDCLFNVSIVGFILTLIFIITARDKKELVEIAPPSWAKIKVVLTSKNNWLLTLYSGLAFSPVAVFGGLWGNPFLQQAYHLTKTQSASCISLIFIGLGVGAPIIGFLSDQLNERRNVMIVCTLSSALALMLVLFWNGMPFFMLPILLFFTGFGLGAFMLVYSIGKELNSLTMTATVIAMINASDAVLDSITEPGIGWLLDRGWDGALKNGLHYFSTSHYQMALMPLGLYLILAAGVLLFIKDNSTVKKHLNHLILQSH